MGLPSKILLSISVFVIILSNHDHGLYGTEVPVPPSALHQSMPQGDASRMMFQQGAPFGHPPSTGVNFQPGAPGFPAAVAPGFPGHAPGYSKPGVNLGDPFVAETLKSLAKVTELAISGLNLPNMDRGSLSDPFCITELRAFNAAEDAWVKIHQTETIGDDLNPAFAEKPLIPPSYGDRYQIKFTLFDLDLNSSSHDLLGYVECSLKEIMSQSVTEKWLKVKPRNKPEVTSNTAKVIIRTEKLIDNNNEVHLTLRGADMAKKARKLLGSSSSNLYIAIYKQTPPNTYTVVHMTEPKKNDVAPTWMPFGIPFRSLCNGQEQRILKFVCKDKQKKKADTVIGEFETTYAELRDQSIHQKVFEFKKNQSMITGYLHYALELRSYPTFTEYLMRGLEINVNIAIDFSNANGPLQKHESLHFQYPNGAPNKYQQAIRAVVAILEAYDYNKSFPVFGFGARTGGKGPDTDKMFPLDPAAPERPGVNGVLEVYRQFLSRPNVAFGSQVLFAPVIRRMIDNMKIQVQRNPRAYFILVIFTAGQIDDMQETEEAIQKARALPLSILIIGVGDEGGSKFDNMEILDGDHVQKTSNNIRSRDIVQFVAISQHVSSFVDTSASLALAGELLAELPSQVIVYMKLASLMQSTAPQQYQHGGFPPPPSMYMGGLPPPYHAPQPAMMGPNLTSMQSNISAIPHPLQYQNASQQWPPASGYAAPPANMQSIPRQGSQHFSGSFAPQNPPPDASMVPPQFSHAQQNAMLANGTVPPNFAPQHLPPDSSMSPPPFSNAHHNAVPPPTNFAPQNLPPDSPTLSPQFSGAQPNTIPANETVPSNFATRSPPADSSIISPQILKAEQDASPVSETITSDKHIPRDTSSPKVEPQ